MVKKIVKALLALLIMMTVMPVQNVGAANDDNYVYLAFDANGGSGEAPEKVRLTVEEYEKFIMPECPFGAPEGKVFVCWVFYLNNDQPNNYNYPGRHPAIPINTQVGDTLVVYALWADPADVCKIVYEPNGGQGTMSPEYAPWELLKNFKLPECGFTNDRGIFKNWSDDQHGTEVHFPESPTDNGEFHIYAVWEDAYYITIEMGKKHKELIDLFETAMGDSANVTDTAVILKYSSVQSLTSLLKELNLVIGLLISHITEGTSQFVHNGEQFFYLVPTEDVNHEWDNTSLAAAYADIITTYRGKKVDKDTSLTVVWLKTLEKIDAELKIPVCGALVKSYIDETNQTIIQEGRPEVIFSPDQHVSHGISFATEQGSSITITPYYTGSYWIDDEGQMIGMQPEGEKIVGGQEYRVVITFQPEYPYGIDNNTKGTVNGQEVRVTAAAWTSYMAGGTMQTTVTAVHDWSEWEYDFDACTKTRTCAGCGQQETKNLETFTLTFDLSGGTLDGKTGEIKMKIMEGKEISIPEAPEKKGYRFLYWKGSKHYPGDKYQVTEPHVFKAVYASEAPATGDNTNIELYIGLTAGAVVIAAVCGIYLAIKNRKDE